MKKYKKMISAGVMPLLAVSVGLGLASCGSGIDSKAPSATNRPAATQHMFAIVASAGDNTVYSVPVAKNGALSSPVSGISVASPMKVVVNNARTCGYALTTTGRVQAFSISPLGQLALVGSISAVLSATPGSIIMNPGQDRVYVSGLADGIGSIAVSTVNCSLGTVVAMQAVTGRAGTELYRPNGMAFGSDPTKIHTVGIGVTDQTTDDGLTVVTVVAATGAVTAAGASFIASSATGTDIPTNIFLGSDGLRAFVGGMSTTAANVLKRYTTTATTVTAVAATTAAPVGNACPGLAMAPDNSVMVLACSAGTLGLTSAIVTATDLTAGAATAAIAGITNVAQVAFAPNVAADVSNSLIVLASDGAGAAAGTIHSYTVNRTTGAFTAVNTLSGFTNPRGMAVISQTY